MVNNQATLVMTSSRRSSGNHALGGDGDGIGGGIYVDGGGTSGTAQLDRERQPGRGDLQRRRRRRDRCRCGEHARDGERHDRREHGWDRRRHRGRRHVGDVTISSSIVAGNSGAECSGADHARRRRLNLADDATCALIAIGDRPNTNPLIGPLQVNTGIGRTATHALSPGSPAINAGDPAACKPTDQRGAPRPAGACDIGAFEYVLPTLTVTTTVSNNDGGEDRPADFSVRVRALRGADVAGSPQPGNATGTDLHARSGRLQGLGERLRPLCAHARRRVLDGRHVTLGENQAATCTVTADESPPRRRQVRRRDPGPRHGADQAARRQVPRAARERPAARTARRSTRSRVA